MTALRQATGDQDWPWAVTSFAYTPDGLISSVTNPAGEATAYVHDAAGRVVRETDPLGRVSTTSYDLAGQKVQERRAVGSPLEQATATYTYHADGQVHEVIDPRGYALKHFYDGFGRLETEQHADGQSESYGYDAADNKVRHRRRDNGEATYGHDALNRLAWAAVPGLPLRRLLHDLAGRPARVWDDLDGQGGWDAGEPGRATAYDTAGRVATETLRLPHPAGGVVERAVGFAHDAGGNRTGITWPDGAAAAYAYDALGRMASVSVGGTVLKSWEWDPLGRPVLATLAGGGTVGRSYDRAGRVTEISYNGGALGSLAYAYDAAGQLVRETGPDELLPPLYAESTSYATANPINGYPSVNGQSLAYDGRGNLTGDGVWTFGYDGLDRLASAQGPGVTAGYGYLPTGERAWKRVNGADTLYVTAGGQPLAELDGAGALVRRYVPGPGGLAPAVIGDTQWRFPLTDRRGSVLLLTDGAGTVLGRGRFDAYGRGIPAAGSPFGFTGHRFDPETGLYATPTRYYSPALGRWLQLDPIGIKDGLNRYAYVKNNPHSYNDPSGQIAESIWDAFSLGIGLNSFASNWSAGNYLGAAVDAVGIAVDTAALAIPAIPGGAGAGILAARGADDVAAIALDAARGAADTAANAGVTRGAAAGVVTKDGQVFTGYSTRAGGPGHATNAEVQNAVDNAPKGPFSGCCAEVDALSNAMNAGANIEGATIATVNAGGVRSGEIKPPCPTCSGVLQQFKINPVVNE